MAKLDDIVNVYREQVELLKGQLDSTKEQNVELLKRVGVLQDAIIAVKAPEAYRDFRADTATDAPSMDAEMIARQRAMADARNEHLAMIERPLFSNGDDMIEVLERTVLGGAEITGKSLHGNDES